MAQFEDYFNSNGIVAPPSTWKGEFIRGIDAGLSQIRTDLIGARGGL